MALIGPIVRNDLFFFVTIVALAALMVLFEVRRRQPASLPDSAGRAPQSSVERPPRASLDGVGLCQFVSVHLDGDRGIHLRQERERAFARDRSDLQ